MPFTTTPTQTPHLHRTLALALEALEASDAPFGSVLTDSTNAPPPRRPQPHTHPRRPAANMDAAARASATVYTSGEHCAMCAAAHAWVGLGRIVYVASNQQLSAWLREFEQEKKEKEKEKEKEEEEGGVTFELPVASLPIQSVAPRVEVQGPVPELEAEIKALHRRYAGLAP
ncbi:cytidine deaminase-like protein [Xylaria sp. FL1042]|nr:cytidine deaminase-like protein [Xylaria sp. FL1042]